MSITHPFEATASILVGSSQPDLIQNETLADIFEATANALPNHTALIFGTRKLSYGELNELSNIAASRLIDEGVKPGQIIGLWLPRGIDLLVMQLAIAKSGAAWLPFDEDTPADRIIICLEDANAFGLITCDALLQALHQPLPKYWRAEALLLPAKLPLKRRLDVLPEHPAYVIYTSGSTGKPKGIQINQGAICHFLRSENSQLGINNTDIVYQGFSVAFDMSFEEIWISYLVGAALWIAPKALSTDPEQLPLALIEQQITVLHTVPTLLALFTLELPNVRIINLGGEACPEALANKWASPKRKVFNTYGPTEATVSASLAELQAGLPVTIGRPLPNYVLLVVDADSTKGLHLLPRGETGELCISGPGVAMGYLGRPELTAEKFLINPFATGMCDKRLYRTGDLARIDESGNVQCLGRTDDQVKIRGFRVELGEIESALCQQPNIGTAAVILQNENGIERLIAYVVTDNKAAPVLSELRAALAESLPAYMVPSIIESLTEMPRLLSGKIDRKALRALPLITMGSDSTEPDTPANLAEEVLFSCLTKLFPGQPIHRDADFFSGLGGHSLLAARLASALRNHPQFSSFTVRDIYQYRQIGRIGEVLSAMPAATPAIESTWVPPSASQRWLCGAAQALMLPFLVLLRMSQWLASFFTYHFFTGDSGDSISVAIAASIGVFLLATVLSFFIAIAGKWLIAGRLKAGRYPLWGVAYFRWWLADRLIESAPIYMLGSSPIYIWWLRALGAKVGKEANIGSLTLRAHDLLTIGNGVSIGNAVNLENARVEHGELILGNINLADEACIGSYAVLEGNTSIGKYGHVEGLSALSDGMHVPPDRIWSGSPAQDVGLFDHQSQAPRPKVSNTRLLSESVFFIMGVLLTAILFFIPIFPSMMLVDKLDESYPWLEHGNIAFQLFKYFLLAFPAIAVLIICTALTSAILRWVVLMRLKAGSWPVHSNVYCRRWLVNQIQESSLNILHGVYATIYAPYWYRLLGAKVGRDAEISTAQGVVPDLLTLGDESFIADGVMLGDEFVEGGWMRTQATVISKRCFVGNGAYIPDGTILPENVLIGVHSRAPSNEVMRSGETWLGSPAINLPAREETAGFPESLTFRPSFIRRFGRGLIEAYRIVTPHAVVIAVGYTVVLNAMPYAEAKQWLVVALHLIIAGLLYGVGGFIFIAMLKWLFIFRYSKRSQPMWTLFVWTSEGITNLYEGLVVPNFMRYLRGTPWLPVAFNALGCHIGKGVYLDTTDLTEFDCVKIGDYSELNALVCPQTHLFEDRIMKIDHVNIGNRVSIGARSTVLYSASVADNVSLGPLTLVMKGESIPANSRWSGCPAMPDKQ
ncbi:MAG: amino acid adenylation domain-containing protein [Bdellovibrio sp.]|nr:amino acid adenylation domain-containing protein [Methylotenera sp.]